MLKKIFIIASLCSLVGIAPAYAAKDETAAVASAVEKMRVLFVTPDKAKMSELVADELSYGHSGGKIDTKTSFIDDLQSGVSHFLTAEFKDQTIRVVGNNAIVRHQLVGNTADKGKDPGTVDLKILQVWTKQGGKWVLLARQAAKIPAPAAPAPAAK